MATIRMVMMTIRRRSGWVRCALVRTLRVLATGLALVLGASVGLAGTTHSTVQAAPPGDDEIVAFAVHGVGFGHGRGLSQWGSFGRAVDGQGWQQILDAYYGGTVSGSRSKSDMRVRLLGFDGVATLGVVATVGKAAWNGSAASYSSLYATETAPGSFAVYGLTNAIACPGGSVASLPVPQGPLSQGSSGAEVTQLQQVLTELGFDPGSIDGQFGPNTRAAVEAFQTAHAPPADGTWAAQEAAAAEGLLGDEDDAEWQLLATNVPSPVRFTTTVSQSGAEPGDVLGACRSATSLTHYRGAIELVDTPSGNRVVNELDVENYLRGVVPRESPASWGDAAGGLGMNALRAQSVAARSYGMSQNRYDYADTCDSSSCQVYAGAASRLNPSGSASTSFEQPNTDRAISDTAGTVRLRNGAIVSTEFSASNGPRTAGGSFPAIDDPWDNVAGNPNHRWTRIIDADRIASVYNLSSGSSVRSRVDADSPYDGIWANEVTLGDGRVVSAWDFRNSFGLPAPGFELVPITRGLSNAGGFALIGDSVGESIVGDCCGQAFLSLADGVFSTTSYDTRSSRRTQGGTDDGVAAATRVPVGTGLVVVQLGYNDAPSAMAVRIDAVMEALRDRDVGTVAWVTVSERRTSTGYAATNAAIRDARSRWSELVVLDWHAASDHGAADRWFSDDVHLTATGRAEFSWWLRDSVLAIVGDGFVPPRRLIAGIPLRIPVTGVAGVPEDGVTGVSLNVTAVEASDRGWLRVWSCDETEPETASVNYVAGGVVPNAVLVPVGDSGEVCVTTRVGTDLVVDLTGWFDGGLRSTAGERLVDTRESSPVEPGTPLRVDVVAADDVVAEEVTGVALNVTSVGAIDRGWLRAWPCDEPEPETASVNYTAGAVVPNAVVVPVGESGEICISTRTTTDVVVDLAAWFDSGVRGAAGERLVDTRDSSPVVPGTPLRVDVVDVGGVVADEAVGVALNVTAVDAVDRGWLRVWACDDDEPPTATVNYLARSVVPNAAIVPVGESGEVCISSRVSTDVVVDLTGWFDTGLQRIAAERLVDTRVGLGPIPDG